MFSDCISSRLTTLTTWPRQPHWPPGQPGPPEPPWPPWPPDPLWPLWPPWTTWPDKPFWQPWQIKRLIKKISAEFPGEKGSISSWVSSSKTIITIFRSSPFCKIFVTGSSRWARRKLLRLNLVAVCPKKLVKVIFARTEKYFLLELRNTFICAATFMGTSKWVTNGLDLQMWQIISSQLKIISWPHYDGGILKNLEKAMSFGDCEMIEGIVGILW